MSIKSATPRKAITKDSTFLLPNFSLKINLHAKATKIGYIKCNVVATPTPIYEYELYNKAVVKATPIKLRINICFNSFFSTFKEILLYFNIKNKIGIASKFLKKVIDKELFPNS